MAKPQFIFSTDGENTKLRSVGPKMKKKKDLTFCINLIRYTDCSLHIYWDYTSMASAKHKTY